MKASTSVLTLDNLHCADCAANLEKAVGSLAGVESAQVNIIAGKIKVRHQGDEGPIRALIARQGYLAKDIPNSFWRQSRTISTLVTALLIGLATLLPQPGRSWLLIAAVGIGGWLPAKAGLVNLFSTKSLDINFLMTIAIIGAVSIGELGEGATVVLLFALSHSLEAYTMGRTRRSVHKLMELAPDTAWIEKDGQLTSVPTTAINLGQNIIVKPGERIPVDGSIFEGTSEVNQGQLTGESMPVTKGIGDPVFAGSINGSGRLTVVAEKTAAQSSLARVVSLVEEAATSRPPVQQFVDSFARWYTPLVIFLALAISLTPPLILGLSWKIWLYRGLTLLVVACPCALVISTPVSIVSALGNAARRGVLIKNGAALERAAKTELIAFDKTGTLTKGEPSLTGIQPVQGYKEDHVLRLAAAIEEGSTHPLAGAILTAASKRQLQPIPSWDHKTLPGHGAAARVEGKLLYAVSPAYASSQLGLTSFVPAENSQVVLAEYGRELAQFAFQDSLRPDAIKTIGQLRDLGIKPVMLTGDRKVNAKAAAAAVSISSVYSQLLPEDKLVKISELREQGSTMMVGDGINDAPALAAADVGVAMGVIGSDTALEAADVALMDDNLRQLPFLIRLSRKSLRTIRVNIWFAIVIKLLAVLLVLPGWLSLWLAILADTGAAVIVTMNGMRLLGSR